jgi:hypothetical protein
MSDFPQSAPQSAVKADPKWFVMGGVVSIVAWLALVPLFFLIYQSFRTPGTARKPAVWTLGNYLEAYSSSDTLVLFANSVEFAAGTAILALVIGTALAWMTERTNTPLQALAALNDTQLLEAARVLSESALRKAGASFDDTAAWITARVLSRSLSPEESAIVRSTFDAALAGFKASPDDARKFIAQGESKPDDKLDPASVAAWLTVTNQIMNLDEALNK